MAGWSEFEAAEPEFALRVKAMLTRRKHLTMATLRRNRSPRISGTEIQFVGGELLIGSMTGARKSKDLRNDARIAIHGPTEDPPSDNPAAWAGEAKVSGSAEEVEVDRFRIDIEQAVITRLNEEGNKLVIESWASDKGYRRIERD